jgi:hypothetical protein
MAVRRSDGSSLGWAVFRQSRVLVILVLASLFFLVAGVLLAGFVAPVVPARVPARAGLITARVEVREIRSTVIARADVSFADPVGVDPGIPEGVSSPVVTGRVPKVGDVARSGDVVLEVSGRPIFALSGKFPAYRSLSAGMSGPDVTMLRKALKDLGYSAGGSSDVYDAALAGAVAKLYSDHGYSAANAGDRAKQAGVRDAEDSLTDAKAGLKAAQRDLKQATVEDNKTALKEAVSLAKRAVSRAQEALKDARQDALAVFPASEVVFLTSMPRRVDVVNVRLGSVIGETNNNSDEEGDGSALVLSGNTIKVVAQVPLAEAVLLEVGDLVEIEGPDAMIDATVSSICAEAGLGGTEGSMDRCAVGIKLGDLGGVDRSELLGNVQATIQVGASGPDALAVPIAAVSAGVGGKARVQQVSAESLNTEVPVTVWVEIEPGLSAEGYVEIKSSTPTLAAGDLVVLGIAGNDDTGDGDGTEPPR